MVKDVIGSELGSATGVSNMCSFNPPWLSTVREGADTLPFPLGMPRTRRFCVGVADMVHIEPPVGVEQEYML